MAIKYYCSLCKYYNAENNKCSLTNESPNFNNEECENYREKEFSDELPETGCHANVLTKESMSNLENIAKWLKIISIIGFVGISMLTLTSIFFIMIGGEVMARVGLGMLILSVVFGGISYCMMLAGKNVSEAVAEDSQDLMTKGLSMLKNSMTYIGLLLSILAVGWLITFLLEVVINWWYISYVIGL